MELSTAKSLESNLNNNLSPVLEPHIVFKSSEITNIWSSLTVDWNFCQKRLINSSCCQVSRAWLFLAPNREHSQEVNVINLIFPSCKWTSSWRPTPALKALAPKLTSCCTFTGHKQSHLLLLVKPQDQWGPGAQTLMFKIQCIYW